MEYASQVSVKADPMDGARVAAKRRFSGIDAVLSVSARETRSAALLRREAEFTLEIPGRPAITRVIYWEISGPLEIPRVETIDFAAIATLFLAMRNRARLVLRGPVTSIMLRNLEELNEAWNQLRPADYALVPIETTELVPDRLQALPGNSRAVLAFSGGLDACFTLIRHLSGHAGHRTAEIASAMLVHGFDVPLSEAGAFEIARESAQRALDEVGVKLTVVRTNWREVAETDWEMDHMAAIAACLHNFSGACDIGLLGSDLTYAFNFWPWGSNPAIDPFLSGGRFTLRMEGQAFQRTARAELVAAVPALASRLRVCWAGPMTGTNCGRCEKCVRTQLNFIAAGHDPGPAFPVRATLWDMLSLNARHPALVNYLIDIVRASRRNRIGGVWRHVVLVNWLLNRALLPLRPIMAPGRLLRHRPKMPAAWRKPCGAAPVASEDQLPV